MGKYELFELFHRMEENPNSYSNWFRNRVFMEIAIKYGFDEYDKIYPNKFGL